MISIADVVKSQILESPFLEVALARGIISYSALARDLAPQIKKKLLRPVSRGSIVMALKRLRANIKTRQINLPVLNDITITPNLVEFNFYNSGTVGQKQKELLEFMSKVEEGFFNLSHNLRGISIIVEKNVQGKMAKIFSEEKLHSQIGDLCALTIKLPAQIINIPGVYYNILKKLAWKNINIIEVISTYAELSIILKRQDADQAFLTLI